MSFFFFIFFSFYLLSRPRMCKRSRLRGIDRSESRVEGVCEGREKRSQGSGEEERGEV